jgi:hypothetical protein
LIHHNKISVKPRENHESYKKKLTLHTTETPMRWKDDFRNTQSLKSGEVDIQKPERKGLPTKNFMFRKNAGEMQSFS